MLSPKRPFIFLVLLWTTLAAVFAAAREAAPRRYIVELTTAPVAEQAVRARLNGGLRGTAAAAHRTTVRAEQARMQPRIAARNGTVIRTLETVANAFIVEADDASIQQIATLPGVKRVYQPRQQKMLMDRAVLMQKVAEAWDQLGGSTNAGKGMKIAILDSGITIGHPSFDDTDFTTPEGFPLTTRSTDVAYTNRKVIVARSYVDMLDYRDVDYSARDLVGHGTALASVTTGIRTAGPKATIQGVAPGAWLGVYKIFGTPGYNDSTNDNAVIAAIEDAVNDGMDVINLSLGSVFAYRFDDDPEAQAIERATAAGVIVVCAAGNSGPDYNTVSSPGTAPSSITVGAVSNDRMFATGLTVDGQKTYAAIPGTGLAPASAIVGTLADVSALDTDGLACNSFAAGSLKGKIALILRGTCTFEVKLKNVQAAGAVAGVVYAASTAPAAFTMSVGTATLPAEMISNSDGLLVKAAIAENASLAATLAFTEGPVTRLGGQLTDFGSSGPSVDMRIKPDLVAVGQDVYMATQSIDYYGDMYDSSGFLVADGTSFATPMVAGAAALLKAARPGLTFDQYRSLLINSAAPVVTPLTGDRATMLQTGAGLLDVKAALNSTVAAYPTSVSLGAGTDVNTTSTVTLTNLGAAEEAFALTYELRAGTLTPWLPPDSVVIPPGGSVDVPAVFYATGPEAGAHEGYIVATGTTTGTVARIPVWYSVTSDVPATISILDAPVQGSGWIYFRVLDSTGVSLPNVAPEVTVTSGGWSVGMVNSYDSYVPGLLGVSVSPGNVRTAGVFQIKVGDLTRQISIAR